MNNRLIFLMFACCLVVYLIGLQLPVMDIDASQYASISREMLVTGSFLQVYDLGVDYLDKPPMLFWLSALSMKIFGINHFAYRLPSFIFALLAIYATYRITILYYKKEIAIFAALILGSCQGMFLIVHDVRTDTMLMGWVTVAIWQLAEWNENRKLKHFIIACIAITGGMMTKGPIALLVPIFSFVPHWILKRQWRNFFRWEYLLGIVIIAVLLTPMSIGLYQQFDLHPEKIVNGKTGVSGLRFFYWTQSFGRITGENTWNEYGYFFFLLQNMLWSFLPWIFFFLFAIGREIMQIFQQRFKLGNKQEWISTGGFIVTYVMLSRSQAQLPHYIFIVFPLASIITARFLYALINENEFLKLRKFLFIFHSIFFALLWTALVVILWWAFPEIPKVIPVIAFIVLGTLCYLLLTRKLMSAHLVVMSLFTIAGLNLFVNSTLYPRLLKYQAGSEVGKYITNKNLSKEKVFISNYDVGRSMHFYGQSIFERNDSLDQFKTDDIILTSIEHLPTFDSAGLRNEILFTGGDYHISKLSLRFLNPTDKGFEIEKICIDKD